MPKAHRKSPKRKEKSRASAPKKARRSLKSPVKPAVSAQVETSAQRKWRPEYAGLARKVAAVLGATDREIAEVFSVDVRTFHRWKLEHPELVKALKPGKEVPDSRVERSLYNRATGYSFDSEELFVDRHGVEHRMTCVKHVPPDVTAQIFWLKNRRPDEWRDRQEINHTVTTADDLAAARRRALERSVVAEQTSAAA